MEKKRFTINTDQGLFEISGFIEGDLGIHKDQNIWYLTHIPSGRYIAYMKERKNIEYLMNLVSFTMDFLPSKNDYKTLAGMLKKDKDIFNMINYGDIEVESHRNKKG